MERIEILKNRVLKLMKEKGYGINKEIFMAVDPKLPFMGYTTEKNGQTWIVVSGWATKSEMLMGLLIHELSHVYRIQTDHPSHNYGVHNQVYKETFGGKKLRPYQQEIVHNILNSIQDLYADDIFFKVIPDNRVDMSSFFLDWIKIPDEEKSKKDRWVNAGHLVSAAFAQANLERHGVVDFEGKVDRGVKDFLKQIKPEAAERFDYFKMMMVNLPETVSQEEMKKILLRYTGNFRELAEQV